MINVNIAKENFWQNEAGCNPGGPNSDEYVIYENLEYRPLFFSFSPNPPGILDTAASSHRNTEPCMASVDG